MILAKCYNITLRVIFLLNLILLLQNSNAFAYEHLFKQDSVLIRRDAPSPKGLRYKIFMKTYSSPVTAISSIQEYIELMVQKNDVESESYGYHLLGYCYGKIGDYNKQKKAFLESLRIACENDLRKREVSARMDLGVYYEGIGDFDMALEYYDIGFEMAKAINNKLLTTRATINIGNIYKVKGEYIKALQFLKEAINSVKENKYIGYYASISYHLGDVHEQLEDYQKALEYYENGLKWAEETAISSRTIEGLHKIAEVKLRLKLWNTSYHCLKKADSISKSNKLKYQEAIGNYKLGFLVVGSVVVG